MQKAGRERETGLILYNITCLKKEKLCIKASFTAAGGCVPNCFPYISKCGEDIPNSYCQVKMKTFSV